MESTAQEYKDLCCFEKVWLFFIRNTYFFFSVYQQQTWSLKQCQTQVVVQHVDKAASTVYRDGEVVI